MFTLEELVQAEILKSRLNGQSLFFEMTCQIIFWPDGTEESATPCGQRFKFLRGTGGQVVCPKCGGTQNMTNDPELRRAIAAFPVD